MKTVCVCRECGRTIESDFLYCPWCGCSRINSVDENKIVDTVFDKLEKLQQNDRRRRTSQVKDRLDKLEKDLSILALSVEMHK